MRVRNLKKLLITGCFRSLVVTTAFTLIAAFATNRADAQSTTSGEYALRKTFKFKTTSEIEKAELRNYTHAWAKSDPSENEDFDPDQTPDEFYGTEVYRDRRVFIGGQEVKYGKKTLTPAGGSNTASADSKVQRGKKGGTAWAQSLATTVVPSWEKTPKELSATLTVSGKANARGPDIGSAYAYSFGSVLAEGKYAELRGSIFVEQDGTKSVSIKGSEPKATESNKYFDPIYFQVFDPDTGILVDDVTLYDFNFSFYTEEQGDYGLIWESDVFRTDFKNFEIHAKINEKYASLSGALDFVVSKGVVSTSEDSGFFDAILPVVGAAGPFQFELPNAIAFDFESDVYSKDMDFRVVSDSEARAFASVVPLPGAIWFSLGALSLLAAAGRRGRTGARHEV